MKAHVLSTKLNSILVDNKYDRFVSGKSRGKLDYSTLSKISYSSKIFKQKEARKNKDYKVIILADASGSMGGSRARATKASLEMISESLANTDVQYEIWSFNTDVLCLKNFNDKKVKAGNISHLYERHLDDRYVYDCENCGGCFGAFAEEGSYPPPARALCPGCNTMQESQSSWFGPCRTASDNADGLALHLAIERVRELPGHHIVIVLSDGEADTKVEGRYLTKDGLEYAKMKVSKVAQQAIKEGITLCSIGIQSNDVLKHYPKENTIVVQDTNEVGGALIKLISKQIKRG